MRQGRGEPLWGWGGDPNGDRGEEPPMGAGGDPKRDQEEETPMGTGGEETPMGTLRRP